MSDRAGTFYGRILNGRIELEFRDQFKRRIEFLENQKIELKLNKFRNTRTLSQNAYYWACVLEGVMEFSGFTKEEAHHAVAHLYLIDRETNPDFARVKSTTELDTKEFAEYLDKIILLCGEHGVTVEPPPSAVEAEKNAPKKHIANNSPVA